MKNLKKIHELLNECQTKSDKYFALKINETGSNLLGITQAQINPFSAVIMKKEQKGISIIGFFDNKPIKYSSLEDFVFTDEVVIAVDCRKDNNYKVFYQINKNDEDFEKITTKTQLSTDDLILIFWEDMQMSCLTFCSFDSERDENIREVITANTEPVKRLLRGITREFISPYFKTDK
ncbi:hypothetical protein [Bacillus toyonensis]|uniref:hypothetical protein n=1 Tax=Bacillus toyonensis TaxID=155322 RepID=UPI00027955D8|nr:hypothetical protein [Bacillus toyonensis]MDP9744698.1 hypothetical protein [Bacillus thuringiensis]EJQ91280.1 hypothetical protein IGO_01076 [Bacillus toyonensis]HDR7223712.1 hypothetical protein [Bacillus toyonensis]HDR7346737.1 hypothetical protein [Bacillus toyonensis]HDR7397234.1 hypothetical protein [Bacillus toyonensis]